MQSKDEKSSKQPSKLKNKRVSILVRKAIKYPARDDWQTYEYGIEADVPAKITIEEAVEEITVDAIVALRKAFRGDYSQQVSEREATDNSGTLPY